MVDLVRGHCVMFSNCQVADIDQLIREVALTAQRISESTWTLEHIALLNVLKYWCRDNMPLRRPVLSGEWCLTGRTKFGGLPSSFVRTSSTISVK